MSAFPHGGDVRGLAAASGRAPEEFLDFSASINPLGPPEWLRPVISSAVSQLVHYPDPHCRELIRAASVRLGLPESMLVAGNGTSELLFALVRVCALGGLNRAVIPSPCYCDYRTACLKAGVDPVILPMRPEHGFGLDPQALSDALSGTGGPALAFIARPNNPTGLDVPAGDVRGLCEAHPDCLFVVDEAFGSFVDGFESLTPKLPANACVLLSLTKMFAIPGLRLGLAAASEPLAGRLRDALAPWSVNALAQAVGVKAMGDTAFEERTRQAVRGLRQELAGGLSALPGVTVLSGAANYLFCRLDGAAGTTGAPALNRGLIPRGMAVRDCSNFAGLDSRYVRVAVRPQAENVRLLDAMAALLDGSPARPGQVAQSDLSGQPGRPGRRRTPALMVQGTTSNAGKSVIAAALCRILRQDGVRVAPFKAQNMSLNSHVTLRGEEMGRAQVLQARACGIEPDARMNPVLLKPCSDTGSQVIVMGRPVGNMRVREYVAYKPTAFAAAKDAYASLSDEYDAVILEGAGSPAEVNLKHHDMVNMAMAAHAGARVLLVGDIDRGGVFAALTGTMELLSESERALVGGYVLNRFRGDPSLLDPAHRFMLETTGKPVLGVVPNIESHGLPEEDSVSFKAGQCFVPATGQDAGRDLDIAIADIPHISNFTDFDALAREPDVSLRVVRSAGELGRPDALLLPGSKNTLADLAALEQSGLAQAIRDLEATEIVGICAGLQMLGQTLLDPLGLESSLGSSPGLGFLPLTTELMADKTLRRTQAVHLPSGLPLDGYEIHHGATAATGQDTSVLASGADGSPLAWADASGRVWGTYLHGVFDADGFRRWWLNALRGRKGLPPLPEQPSASLDAALDRLAAVVRASLDMKAVYALLGL